MFFDGICGLCNRSVDFLIKIDKNNNLLFAPIQGETAQKKLHPKYIDDIDSMALLINGKTLNKSTAVLKAVSQIGGLWYFTLIFLFVPEFFRDWIYMRIAKNRYSVFGKNESCRMPTKEEQDKILL